MNTHTTPLPVTEADLHAWCDARLPSARATEVEEYLAARPEEAARIAAYERQRIEMKLLFDPILTESVPQRLTQAATPRMVRWQGRLALAASLVLGVALGWNVKPAPDAVVASVDTSIGTPAGTSIGNAGNAGGIVRASAVPTMARQAAIAHATFSPEVLHPVEVPATQEAHLTAWLSKRLGRELRVPHLAPQGYALVGGRLLPDASAAQPAAQFMYETRDGQRLTLYVSVQSGAAEKDTAFRYAQENNIGVFYWVDRGFGYALSGDTAKSQLLAVAEAAYKQLNP